MSGSSPAEGSRRFPALIAVALSLVSLWFFASAATPRWLDRASMPIAGVAVALSLLARRRDTGAISALGLSLSLVTLASELAFTALARM